MNEIQRKLQLIEKQTASSGGSAIHLVTRAPLFFCASGFIIGITLQYSAKLPLLFAVLMLSSCIAAVSFALFLHSTKTAFYAAAAFVASLAAGSLWLASYTRMPADDIAYLINEKPVMANLRGTIISEPFIQKETQYPDFSFTDPKTSFYLDITQVETTQGWSTASGCVRVQVAQPIFDLSLGDNIELYCWLDRFKPAGNPGQFDTAAYLARNNIFLSANAALRESIILLARDTSIINRIPRWLRSYSLQTIAQDGSDISALQQALLIGRRSNIYTETYESFRRTGMLHYISLSGLHLGILIGFVWYSLRLFGFLKPARAIFSIVVLIIFMLIVPPRPPTVRAAIIVAVFCASWLFRRTPNSYNSLALAALITLLIRPTSLFEAGWQLSFAAVLGILAFTQPTKNILEKITAHLHVPGFDFLPYSLSKCLFNMKQAFITGLAVGFAAWFAGLGILTWHFYTINPLAPLWTVLLAPFVTLIIILGFMKLLIAAVLPSIAALLTNILNALTSILVFLTDKFANVPFSEFCTGHIPLWFVIFFYLALALWLFGPSRFSIFPKLIAALIFVSLFTATLLYNHSSGSLDVTVLDVGHGQAIYAKLPNGANVLFDAGSLYNRDIAKRVIMPFLRYSGHNSLDYLFISHNDSDHCNAVLSLVSQCRIKKFFFTPNAHTSAIVRKLEATKNYRHKTVFANCNFENLDNLSFLWPPADSNKLSDNDASLVTLLTFADRRILLCSDIETQYQEKLIELYPDLKCDIVLLPHHGSAKTMSPQFINSLSPVIVIASCGNKNAQKLSELKLEFLPPSLLTTADHGAINITVDHNNLIVSPWCMP